MGLLDSLAKTALGSMLGGSSNKQDPSAMLSGLLESVGGLEGLKGKFEGAGLGEQFSSWVSTDENKPLEQGELQNAIGQDTVQKLSNQMGMKADTIMPLLAQFLPQIIDKLTPKGAIDDNNPSGSQLQSVLTSVMSSGLGGLFGGKS